MATQSNLSDEMSASSNQVANSLLLAEWERALAYSEGRQVRLKAYAKMRIAQLSVQPTAIDHTARKRHDAHKTYNYKVDKNEESRNSRQRLVKQGGYFPRRNWQPQEEGFIYEQFSQMSVLDMAHKLGRSYESVMHKMNRLGLEKNKRWA